MSRRRLIRRILLPVVLLFLVWRIYKRFYRNKGESFCPCGVDISKEEFTEKYPLPTLYKYSYGTPDVRGEESDDTCQPYYKRSWPVCQPCGGNTDLNCQTQSYVEPESFTNRKGLEEEKAEKDIGEDFSEGYIGFPRDSLSCQPGCQDLQPYCQNDPYGQHYYDPRWKNGRFWTQQEWAPGLQGDPARWYPTAPMTS